MSEVAPQASDVVGVLISSDVDRDHVVMTDLVQCKHCRFTWAWRPGLRLYGTRLGRCMKCGGMVCGRAYCVALGCTCQEQILENIEAGRPLDYKPIRVSVAGLVLP